MVFKSFQTTNTNMWGSQTCLRRCRESFTVRNSIKKWAEFYEASEPRSIEEADSRRGKSQTDFLGKMEAIFRTDKNS